MPETKDFLNPNSMLTPGIVGGLTVSISMPLSLHFGLSVKWVALTVSFLFGALIVFYSKDAMAYLQRGIYWILNSLIIFSVGIGAAANIDSLPQPPHGAITHGAIDIHKSAVPNLLGSLSPELMPISTAHAQEGDSNGARLRHDAGPRAKPPRAAVPERYGNSSEMNAKHRKQQEYLRNLEAYQRRWSW